MCLMTEVILARVTRVAAMHRGDACDDLSLTTACPMVTMASALVAHIWEKVLYQWGRLHAPFTHRRPPDTRLSQCSMPTQSAVGAPYQAKKHPTP